MFGLDARIALAILAIVSLSIGLSEEKETVIERTEQTDIKLKLFKEKFLNNWDKLMFEGFFVPDGNAFKINKLATILMPRKNNSVAGYPQGEYYTSLNFSTFSVAEEGADVEYTHPYNGKAYISSGSHYLSSLAVGSLKSNKILMYNNFEKDYFNTTSNFYLDLKATVATKILMTLMYINDKEGEKGKGSFSDEDIFTGGPYYYAGEDGFGNPIKLYFIIEHNVNKYSPLEYILNVVAYSYGENGQLDSTLPTNLNELKNFTPSGDDIVEIFSDKKIYLKAKVEIDKRLETIKERIIETANANYQDRVSLCISEATPSASCDLDSDGDFDEADSIAISSLNPYPKSNADSVAQYIDNSNRFNESDPLGNEMFILDLGLLSYYHIDLFGNHIRYNSNVDARAEEPFEMEVWY